MPLGSRLCKRGLVLLGSQLDLWKQQHPTHGRHRAQCVGAAHGTPRATRHMPGCAPGISLDSLYPSHEGNRAVLISPFCLSHPGMTIFPYIPSADAITRMDYNVLEALPLLRPLISCHGETPHLAPFAAFCLCPKPGTWPAGRNEEKSPTDPELQSSWLGSKVLCFDNWGQTPPPTGWGYPRNSFQ